MLHHHAADEGSTSAQLPAAQDRDPVSAGGVASFLGRFEQAEDER